MKTSKVVVTLLLLSSVYLHADSIPEIVKKAKPAILEIVAMDERGSPVKQGTGFFISSDGLAVTNFHVIQCAGSLTAIDDHGAFFILEKIVSQPKGIDIAILKFRVHDVPFLKVGRSIDKVEGEKVIVIGNPKGLEFTVSDGIIAAFRKDRSLIQISAPISPGSSGSPVMDENGQVIGVASLQIVDGQNLNFAISAEQISAALAMPEQYSDLIAWGWDASIMEDSQVRLKTVPDIVYIDRDTGKLVSSSVHQHRYDPKDRASVPALKEVTVDFATNRLLDGCTGKVVASLYAPQFGGFKAAEWVDPKDHQPFPWFAVPPATPVNSQ